MAVCCETESQTLYKASNGPICRLDSWHAMVSMPAGEKVELPHYLRHMEECILSEDVKTEGTVRENVSCFEGVFDNYFSIGMDAQVAYGFHHLRNTKPYLAQGPITNKLIYSGYSCTQGWFCTPCVGSPGLRGLKNILRLHIKKVNCSEWEQIPVPSEYVQISLHFINTSFRGNILYIPAPSEYVQISLHRGNILYIPAPSDVRSIVALNLRNYGSGRNPWGKPKPEYLEQRGFVESHADDGLLEIFGLKQGWHASFVMVELVEAKHIA